MKRFAGECIGGPFDGKHVINDRPYLRVPKFTKVKSIDLSVIRAPPEPYVIYGTYNWDDRSERWIWDESY